MSPEEYDHAKYQGYMPREDIFGRLKPPVATLYGQLPRFMTQKNFGCVLWEKNAWVCSKCNSENSNDAFKCEKCGALPSWLSEAEKNWGIGQ